jgi:hypothetical protein
MAAIAAMFAAPSSTDREENADRGQADQHERRDTGPIGYQGISSS